MDGRHREVGRLHPPDGDWITFAFCRVRNVASREGRLGVASGGLRGGQSPGPTLQYALAASFTAVPYLRRREIREDADAATVAAAPGWRQLR